MWNGVGRVGSKNSKPILALPHGAGLKSCLIPALPPLQGKENLCGVKRGEVGQAGQGKITIPSCEEKYG